MEATAAHEPVFGSKASADLRVSPSLQPRAGQKPAQSWEHPTGISGFWSTTILFDHGTRRWRFVEAEIDFVPSPFVRSGGDGLHTPLQKLAEIVCRDTKKRQYRRLADLHAAIAESFDLAPETSLRY